MAVTLSLAWPRTRRARSAFTTAVAALATGVVVTGAVVTATPGGARADTVSGTSVYVDNTSGCSDSSAASGTEAIPFCSISAAEGVVKPGYTVMVEGGTYPAVTITVSGTPGHPVTFEGTGLRSAIINPKSGMNDFLISGVHDVVVSGFETNISSAAAYEVTGGSSGIVLNGADITTRLKPGVQVDSASDVTVSRSSFIGIGPEIQVNSGASGTVITGNTLRAAGSFPAVSVTRAPGTDVTGNTLVAQCGPAIDVTGASAGASIQNNVISWLKDGMACGGPDGRTAISVSSGSTPGSTADYNLIDPTFGTSPAVTATPYDWGGTSYPTLAAFQQATGQGSHDIVADPGLGAVRYGTTWGIGTGIWYPLDSTSPAIDSANAGAPGELASDQFADPRTDDPNVKNTGTGAAGSYFDRGAVELQGPATSAWGLASSGPLTVTGTQSFTPKWTVNGPLGHFVYYAGSRFPVVTMATRVPLTFRTAGLVEVTEMQTTGSASSAATTTFTAVVGADYTPVTPVRILDTRNGTGTGTAAPVPARGTLTLSVPSVDGVPASSMSAVVMNVTVTQPAKVGFLTVYPGTGPAPGTSNLNFSAGQTVPNLVTVPVSDGTVSFHNASSGSVQVVADFEGFYGPGGYGFQPQSPVRVLDTRIGTGAAKAPVSANGVLRLSLAGRVPPGTAAVVLNVTATSPQDNGYLRVYPDSPTVPDVSSVNFSRGETVPNLVIVPLRNGIADIKNSSRGTVQVVADLEGYYAASASGAYVPYTPTRIEDTRTTGGPVKPDGTVDVGDAFYTWWSDCYSNEAGCPVPDAIVANVTVTGPTRPGYLTIYPYGARRPNASNVNFVARETVPNLAMPMIGNTSSGHNMITIYNASSGTTQVVVDEYGYFIPAAG